MTTYELRDPKKDEWKVLTRFEWRVVCITCAFSLSTFALVIGLLIAQVGK